jgi:hypothetical protein
MYITTIHIVLTNTTPTEKLRVVGPALVRMDPKRKVTPLTLDLDSDVSLDTDTNPDPDPNAAVSLNFLEKGKGKVPEDLNGGPAPKVRTTFSLNNVLNHTNSALLTREPRW